jgi:hypothetical protein
MLVFSGKVELDFKMILKERHRICRLLVTASESVRPASEMDTESVDERDHPLV